jgi:hypothetical protein
MMLDCHSIHNLFSMVTKTLQKSLRVMLRLLLLMVFVAGWDWDLQEKNPSCLFMVPVVVTVPYVCPCAVRLVNFVIMLLKYFSSLWRFVLRMTTMLYCKHAIRL